MGVLRRLRYWLESDRRGEALREEMELHVAETAEALQAEGMAAERAWAEARRRFGNTGLKQEESREVWMTRFLTELGQDLCQGFRMLAANKAFSALAVLSLALGIGANTAIYSFLEAILLRSLPVAAPESLVVMNWQSPLPQNANKEWVHVMHGVQGMAWPGDDGTMFSGMFPYGAFESLGEENPVFSTLFGYFNGRTVTLSAGGQATSVQAADRCGR
jgi:macrolide transport system ATP-binding/permease protein